MNFRIKLEPMGYRHLARMARIESECFSAPHSEKMLREYLDTGRSAGCVAEAGGEVAGYGWFLHAGGEGYIVNVATAPAFRRAGVASAVMGALEAEARRLGLDFLSLEVRVSNSAAIGLYEGCGYSLRGRRRGFYSDPAEDGLIYTKFFKGEEGR